MIFEKINQVYYFLPQVVILNVYFHELYTHVI